MPSFSLVALQLISKPVDRSSNSILRALRVLRGCNRPLTRLVKITAALT